jgi:hypothetical protein
MKPRVYVIEYDFNSGCYTNEPKLEHRVLHFTREERQDFINVYKDMYGKYYNLNIKTYFAELEEIDVEEMMRAI